MKTDLEIRALPADPHRQDICGGCKQDIVWAITVAGPNGRGGKNMPLDPIEDLAGNVAVTRPHTGQLRARVITKDETIDRPFEYAGMTHFASCPVRHKPEPPEQLLNVVDLAAERRRRRGRKVGGRR